MANKSYIYIGTSLLVVAAVYGYLQMRPQGPLIDAADAALVTKGKTIYQTYCASCHGSQLQGESKDWRSVKDDGTLPAPPHDASGHTWHHDDQTLFEYTQKGGAVFIGGDFKSAMPGFGKVLSDREIRAALSYIKSTWPKDVQNKQTLRNQLSK